MSSGNLQRYRYQDTGIKHLVSMPFGNPYALLADAPGTGKTIMGIGAAQETGCKTGIILCPAVIKEQWAKQMVKWGLCAEDEVQILYGLSAQVDNRPWCILNYELVREKEIAKQIHARNWHCAMLDEAHRLKTHDSKQTQAVLHKDHGIARKAYWIWSLSGTIMPNRPLEMYSLLKCFAPKTIAPYDNYQAYIRRYCGYMGKGASNIEELTERIQPFMLRRELEDVWGECPDVIENEVWLDVDYESHPEWSPMLTDHSIERRIVAESKVPQVAAYVVDRLESGIDKLAIFAYHRNVIDSLYTQLSKYQPAKIYGGISPKKRLEQLAQFIENPHCRVILLQIASAGEGIDGLQSVCAELIEAEPEWSPGREDQAVRRIKRLGQTRPVILTKLYALNSYEERIVFANARKRKVIDVVLAPNDKERYVMSLDKFAAELIASIHRVASAIEGLKVTVEPAPQAVAQPLPNLQAAPAATQSVPVAAVQPASVNAGTGPIPLQFAPPATAPVAAPLMVPAQVSTPVASPAAAAVATLPAAPAVVANPQNGATAPVANMTREQFQGKVLQLLQPLGANGQAKLVALNTQFGVPALSALPESQFELFLQMTAQAVQAG